MSYGFNPFSGTFDLISQENFSYNEVVSGSVLFVPQYQQMIVFNEITIHGDLLLAGDLVMI